MIAFVILFLATFLRAMVAGPADWTRRPSA
jgi:hypothetical protein